jgi:SSS family solute:Na+ symporter
MVQSGAYQVMSLTLVDWIIIVAYMVLSLGIGLVFSKRAGKSIEEFFVSGRALPWWLAGTSMVATTFAADTPLAVTGLVIKNGIAGNWVWWNFAIGGMLTVFLYSRLWRRAGVITDAEFAELRYGGKGASFLRGFRALYLAIPMNCLIVGWVTNAIVKVLNVTMGFGRTETLIGAMAITAIYSVLAGLWGVVITDAFQFIIAMTGCIVLAVLALGTVGGMSGLMTGLTEKYGSAQQSLNFFPDFSAAEPWMPLTAFLIYIGVTWWASWYPGAEPGGGGYVVQRMASCKDEKHSLLATLWFQIAHYAVRPWPWIIVALVALYHYPELRAPGADANVGYPRIMALVLPAGFRGLLLIAFFAAFMSTLATQINWGASYIVSDFYKRFVNPRATQKHYTNVSRIATILLLFLGGIVSTFITSVEGAWKLMLTIGAGTGMVLLLRWYWWRINAWSEISAMIASFIVAGGLQFSSRIQSLFPAASHPTLNTLFGTLSKDYIQILVTAVSTMVVWVLVTFLTPPESDETLVSFYRRVRPGGFFWRRIRRKAPDVTPDRGLGWNLLAWIFGAVLVYFSLFSVGKLLLGQTVTGIIFLAIALASAVIIHVIFSKFGWEKVAR